MAKCARYEDVCSRGGPSRRVASDGRWRILDQTRRVACRRGPVRLLEPLMPDQPRHPGPFDNVGVLSRRRFPRGTKGGELAVSWKQLREHQRPEVRWPRATPTSRTIILRQHHFVSHRHPRGSDINFPWFMAATLHTLPYNFSPSYRAASRRRSKWFARESILPGRHSPVMVLDRVIRTRMPER